MHDFETKHEYFVYCRFWKQLVDSVQPNPFDWSCDHAEGYLMTSLMVCINVNYCNLLCRIYNYFEIYLFPPKIRK